MHRGIEGTAWLISKVALAVTIGLKKSKPQGLNRLRKRPRFGYCATGNFAGAKALRSFCGICGPAKAVPCYKASEFHCPRRFSRSL